MGANRAEVDRRPAAAEGRKACEEIQFSRRSTLQLAMILSKYTAGAGGRGAMRCIGRDVGPSRPGRAMHVVSEQDEPNQSLERTGSNWPLLASATAPAAQRKR